ncbi:MAG TPA: mycofactocin-coupled SDR family oxidoreductase [Acidimicrobiales bacterium]|nr:mycofactocin-coupled SDR family oxidoreductase [Acidimicrobiales bacterium]
MGTLEGRVALVTGAARGQGRAFARRLAAEGADVVAFDICAEPTDIPYPAASEADLDATVLEVEATGRRVIRRVGDVRSQADLDGAVGVAVSAFGRLDIVVASAGISTWGRLWELSDMQWTEMLDIDLGGVWRTFKAAVPAMIEQGDGGSLIAISSVAGLKALPGQAHYVAAKHGLVGLVKAAAVELGPHGIRANSIHPWGVDTVMADYSHVEETVAANPHYAASFGSVLPEPRLATPDDIADAVIYLAGDVSRCVTGAQLRVDMGATIV